jgi:hypothetical protein
LIKEIDYSTFINESPYTDILNPPSNFGLGKNGMALGGGKQPQKARKFMAEKLKRRSILNCELFKETVAPADTKAKTLYMTEKIGEVLGIRIGNHNIVINK